MKNAMRKYPPKGLDDKMGFGKHAELELWWVIKYDPEYIDWLLDDASMDFEMDNEAYEEWDKVRY